MILNPRQLLFRDISNLHSFYKLSVRVESNFLYFLIILDLIESWANIPKNNPGRYGDN